MASLVIHLAVANEINHRLKRNNDMILLGSIAPDLSKQIGDTKFHSHFLNNIDDNIPNMDIFLSLYKKYLDDDFVMGYFIHLYTDFIWFKYFIPEIFRNNTLTKLDGSTINCDKDEMMYYIYNDYTNVNKDILEIYKIDTSIFYKEPIKINNIIKEIPIDKLDIIIKQCANVIDNSKNNISYTFDVNHIIQFITACTDLIYGKIQELLN